MQSSTITKFAIKEDDLSTTASGESGDEVASTSQSEDDTVQTVPATSRAYKTPRGSSLGDDKGIHSAVHWLFALTAGIFLAMEWLIAAAIVLTVAFVTRPQSQKVSRTSTEKVSQWQRKGCPQSPQEDLKQGAKLPGSQGAVTSSLPPGAKGKQLVPSHAPKLATGAPWRSSRVAERNEVSARVPTRFNTASTPVAPQVASNMLKEVSAIMKDQPMQKPASVATKPATVAPWRSGRAAAAGAGATDKSAKNSTAAAGRGPSDASLAALAAALAAAEAAKVMDDGALAAVPVSAATVPAYTRAGIRRELVSIMKDLTQDRLRNAAVAVGRVRKLCIPEEFQAAEFTDILTRTMEERNGPLRRTYVAFVAGLVAGAPSSAFCKKQCLSGLVDFFSEAFEELSAEVPRLDKLVECELVPTLRGVFSNADLKDALPHCFLLPNSA